MNKEFESKQYLIVPNFFSEEECNQMYTQYKNYCDSTNLTPKNNAGYSNGVQVHTYYLFLEKLCMILPKVVSIVEESLLPTYALGRIYHKGADLKKHKDRPACEISLTVNLFQDKEWGLWVESNERPIEIKQNQGDALFYFGCESLHWRDSYEGDQYCQVFFHYVRTKGKYVQHYFDRTEMYWSNQNKFIKGVV